MDPRSEVIGWTGDRLLRGLLATARFAISGTEHYLPFREAGQPVVYILWHGRLLPLTYHRRGEGLVTLISQHRDGEYIASIVRRWGYEIVRGSSSRGGVSALRELLRRVREGKSLAITPDGPRGPREEMKLGALILAQRSGAPIVPVAAGTPSAWWFGKWDRFLIPQPFSKITVAYGEPLFVPRQLDERGLLAYMDEAQARLSALTRMVDDVA